LQQQLLLQVMFKHVKGHQDTRQTTVLSRQAWMNIEMDEHVKQKVSVDAPKYNCKAFPMQGGVV